MTDEITISDIRRKPNPDRDEYEQYIDVVFSNGVKVRHVVDTDGQYLEQVFNANNWDTVWDDVLVEDNFDGNLDEYVMVWLDVTMESLNDAGESWDMKIIRGDITASPTNIRHG